MRQWGIVAGVLSGLFWGASGLLYGELTAEFPALQTSSVLLVLLLVFETMALVASGLNLWKNSGAGFQAVTRSPFSAKSTPLAILAGVLGAPLGMFCYLLAIEQIGVGLAAPISAIYPVVGILLARFWLNEKLTRTAWFGIVLVVGCVALSAGQTEVASLALGGLVLSVLCAFCWGCEIVLSAVAMSRLTDTPNRVADYTYAFRQLGAVGGYIVLITVLPPPRHTSQLIDFINIFQVNHFSLFFLIFCTAVCSAVSYFCYYRAIALLCPIRAMILNMTYPIWIALFSWYNGVDGGQILFAAGILLGTILVLCNKQEHQ